MSSLAAVSDPPVASAPEVHERAFVPALVGIGLVVSVISSLGAPLIPTIAQDLGASLSATQWSLTATLLVGAVASPLLGRLGDGPHRKTVLVGALALVTAGGALAALAGTLGVLVAGRALQGLGLALMPLTMASARDHLPPARAASTIAVLSVVAAVGVGLGYPITGFIAEYADASAAFWFGTAASAGALVLAVLFVPAPTSSTPRGPLDARGAALIGAGVLALLLALEKAPDWGWGSASTLGLLAAAAALLAWWTAHELRVDHPLVELRLVRHRAVLTANVTGLVLGVAMYLGIALITQAVQLPSMLDESIFVAGLTLVPLSVMSTASSRLLPAVRGVVGERGTIPAGATAIAVAMVFFAATGDHLWQAFVTMGIVGAGLGLTFAAMPGLVVHHVPHHETSSAMSFYQVTRYVGFSIGSGLAITLLRAFDGGADVPTPDAYAKTFAIGGGLCLLAAVVAWVLPGDAIAQEPSSIQR
ncbi:MFS transporter [Conexibacter sp. SYSU D00693]|uniref:MFS transporter n=1 Tax=Conexibacter sp. SYSU D00693 TaxID=2812560 RepID=UPI00196B0929|nr:MFS transporter [Conexibacter sp. SYSU D00693]